jgi:hypothetical protein
MKYKNILINKFIFLIYKIMYDIIIDEVLGSIIVKSDETYSFLVPNEEKIYSITNLEKVEKLSYFSYSADFTTDFRFLTTEYRISSDGTNWSEWLELKEEVYNFPDWTPAKDLFLQIKFKRSGESTISSILLKSWEIKLKTERNLVEEGKSILLNENSTTAIIKPPYIYKVFRIDEYELITRGDLENLSIKYRYSQDYGRTVSNWEPFTVDNIRTMKINPIRFFQIEYLFEYTGVGEVKIFDLNLIGDFQNVTLDSQKTNLLALREDCTCLKLELVGGQQSNEDGINSDLLNKTCTSQQLYQLNDKDKSLLYKPYEQNPALALWNKLSKDANQIFGHEVYYFVTDPDKKGIDYTFHEYQLYNYICDGLIKVSVDQNSFPDDNMQINQFDLTLFESFEIHIMKEDFKKIFGVDKRPSKEDFLWFCEINRMFIVEHARQFRQFNNAAVYYKIMLKKYNQSASMQAGNDSIKEKLDRLTRNSTIDELFGKELELDKKSTANQPELRTLSQDQIRLEVFALIERELIENSNNIISKSHYQMTKLPPLSDAVIYSDIKSVFTKAENVSYMCWFNLNDYIINDAYNLFNYYDPSNNLGFKIDLQDEMVKVKINSDEFNLPVSISEGIWYAFLVNVDQRIGEVSSYLYKRDSDIESFSGNLSSTTLRLLHSQTWTTTSKFIEIDLQNAKILASDMKLTNIRMFSDIIPKSDHTKILNQSIIGNDSKFLIFADNANRRITLPNYKLN